MPIRRRASRPAARDRGLERNVVVGDRLERWFVRVACGRMRAPAIHAGAATAAASAEKSHTIGLDFRRVALVAILVVPLTGLKTPLDVNLFSFGEVLLETLG